MTTEDIAKLSDAQVLDLAGTLGPGIIGQELFDRAQEVRTATNDGKFGPALLDPDYGLNITPWDDFSRRDLLAIAREHQLPVASKATRDEIAKALTKARVAPPVEKGIEDGEGAE